MDRETNADSIRALEEQIREHERVIIQLKRTRNSRLNVSKLPPEVLGKIFHWNVTLKGDFDGLDKGSHDFLFVCHHWFEVASRTPEIWSFWGNTPKDWARWCRRSETAPLDLVLGYDDYETRYFDANLRNALKDRVTRDAIRRVHLMPTTSKHLSSIIALLASNHEELRSNSIESFVLLNHCAPPVDVSAFFARYHFPKLRRLELTTCKISSSSWDHLASRTSVLTTLVLDFSSRIPIPSTPQLLSILASNPALQKVKFLGFAVPYHDGGRPSFRVQLRHLRKLRLEGNLRYIIGLLHQLDYPRNMKLTLGPHDFGVADISRTIGPYLRDHLQRYDRPRNGLHLFISSGYDANGTWAITLCVGDAGGVDFSAPARIRTNAFVKIDMLLKVPSSDVSERTILDFITHVPREEVVYFQTFLNPVPMEDIPTQFPNVKALSLDKIPLFAAFPSRDVVGDGRIFPSLEHVLLVNMVVDHGDWGPLMTFLARRVSSGNRLDTLMFFDSPPMSPEVIESIRGMVRELKLGS